MKSDITFRHMDASEALKDHINEKLAKIEKYVFEPAEAHVVLSVENYNHVADVTVHEKNFTAKGMDKSTTMYASIDGAMEKVMKSLRRHKEKVKDDQHKGSPPTV